MICLFFARTHKNCGHFPFLCMLWTTRQTWLLQNHVGGMQPVNKSVDAKAEVFYVLDLSVYRFYFLFFYSMSSFILRWRSLDFFGPRDNSFVFVWFFYFMFFSEFWDEVSCIFFDNVANIDRYFKMIMLNLISIWFRRNFLK